MTTELEAEAEEVIAVATRKYETRRKRLTLGTIVSILAILGTVGSVGRWVLTPWFIAVAGQALANDIDARIEAKVQPTNNGVKALLSSKIDELDIQITMEEARKARAPSKWTDLDAMKLSLLIQQREKARRALADFEQAATRSRKDASR